MSDSIAFSRLIKMLGGFQKRELAALSRFLESPYFNQRADVRGLFETLRRSIPTADWPAKQQLWQAVFPDKPFDDTGLRLLMSRLTKLIEQFWAVETALAAPFDIKMTAANRAAANLDEDLYQQLLGEAERQLGSQPHRDARYWYDYYRCQASRYQQSIASNPDKIEDPNGLNQSLDKAFLAMKLKQHLTLLNHDQLYKRGYTPTPLDNFIAQLTPKDLGNEPALVLYFYGIQLLQNPHDEGIFNQFKNHLLGHGHLLPDPEVRDLYLLAINFAIRQVNDGHKPYFHNMMELYKGGLAQGYILHNGQVSRFTYHNIVSTALQINDIAWAEHFVETWTDNLEKRFRERMYSFSRAKIAYTKGHYAEALPLLQQANYHDPLLNLGARTLLLKIYFELNEHDALHSHLDAFQSYLRRKPDLGYHRTNYQNLIKYTRLTLQCPSSDPAKRQHLKVRIAQEKILTEKEWLLAHC